MAGQDAAVAHSAAGSPEVAKRVVALALGPPPGETTHWTGRDGESPGVSLRSVQRILEPTNSLAASHPHVQAVERPEVRRETQRRRRPLCRSSRPCGRPLGRRKEPDSGARPHPARVADEAGPCRHDDPRLQTSRHHHAVRRPQHPRRHRHRPQHAAPSPPGVHSLPQHDRGAGPGRRKIHAIVDNYATHKHPRVRQWLARHPRWTFHFTPTSASWLNAVEGFFASSRAVASSEACSDPSLTCKSPSTASSPRHNTDPKPFVWTADPKRVLAAVKRGKQALESLH